MQTSPILNPANIASGIPAAAGKQSDAGAPDVPFNQVLSREMSEQRDSAPRETNKTTAGQPASGPARAEAGKPAEEKSKPDDDGAAEGDQTAAAAAAAASAEMLALVASAGQAKAPTDAGKAADDTALAADAAGAGAGKRKLPASAGTAVKPDAVASADALKGKDTAPKAGAEFAAKADKSETTKAQFDAAVRTADAKAASPATAALELAAQPREKPAELPAAALQPMQQAAFSTIQAAGGQAADKLTPPVGTPAWDQALGQKVVWMVAGDRQSATLTLNPPDLGPLQVVLNVSNSHADATFVAAQPEVRQALEAAMPKLRDMLGDAGIQLGQATVNAGTPNQHHAPGEQQARTSHHAAAGDVHSDAPQRVGRVQPTSIGQGLVDTFA